MTVQVEPRLLKKVEAARYCGLDPQRFRRVCPVRPVRLEDKVVRYDRRALDEWLDGLTKTAATMSGEDWLKELDDDEADGDDGPGRGS